MMAARKPSMAQRVFDGLSQELSAAVLIIEYALRNNGVFFLYVSLREISQVLDVLLSKEEFSESLGRDPKCHTKLPA
jgi:hypothetical protein